jgi:hypothetical protein
VIARGGGLFPQIVFDSAFDLAIRQHNLLTVQLYWLGLRLLLRQPVVKIFQTASGAA